MPPPPSLLPQSCLHLHITRLSTFLLSSLQSPPTITTSLPHSPEVVAILQKWKEIGVTQPAVDRLSVATIPAVWKKTALLLEEGFSPQQIAKLIDVPDTYSFLSVSYEKLAACLNFLKSLDVTGQNAGNLLTKPVIYKDTLLSYNFEMLKHKFDRFDELGLDRALLAKMLPVFPSVVAISSQRLGRFLEYLRGLGMDSEALELLSKYPRVLRSSLERTIIPTMSYLQSRGLSKKDTSRLFRLYPLCLTRSVDTTRQLFDCLERLGLQGQIVNVYFQLSRCRCYDIEPRIEWLTSQGFSRAEVCRMVSCFTSMLSLTEQCLSTKMDYLVKVMKRDIEQIVSCPQFLSCSLENRIKPRFNLLTKLEENGTLHDQYSLYVFTLSETRFVKRFVKPPA